MARFWAHPARVHSYPLALTMEASGSGEVDFGACDLDRRIPFLTSEHLDPARRSLHYFVFAVLHLDPAVSHDAMEESLQFSMLYVVRCIA